MFFVEDPIPVNGINFSGYWKCNILEGSDLVIYCVTPIFKEKSEAFARAMEIVDALNAFVAKE